MSVWSSLLVFVSFEVLPRGYVEDVVCVSVCRWGTDAGTVSCTSVLVFNVLVGLSGDGGDGGGPWHLTYHLHELTLGRHALLPLLQCFCVVVSVSVVVLVGGCSGGRAGTILIHTRGLTLERHSLSRSLLLLFVRSSLALVLLILSLLSPDCEDTTQAQADDALQRNSDEEGGGPCSPVCKEDSGVRGRG